MRRPDTPCAGSRIDQGVAAVADAEGQQRVISVQEWRDAELIWDFHQMHHELRPCSAGIGLGSHDLGVASHTVDLYRRGLFPVMVFTGGNSPTTKARFPRGE